MHVLIVGITNSGKSWLAKRIAANAQGRVIVYDPLKSNGWPDECIKFADAKKFFAYVAENPEAYIFCDEAKNFWIDGYAKEAEKLLTQSRHDGQLVFLIAQRMKMIPPTARAQCNRVFAFRQNMDDSIELSREYHEALINCPKLKPREFISSDGFDYELNELNFDSLPPEIDKKQV